MMATCTIVLESCHPFRHVTSAFYHVIKAGCTGIFRRSLRIRSWVGYSAGFRGDTATGTAAATMPPKKKGKKGKKGDKGGADPVKSEANEEEEKKAVRLLPQNADPAYHRPTHVQQASNKPSATVAAPPHKLTSLPTQTCARGNVYRRNIS